MNAMMQFSQAGGGGGGTAGARALGYGPMAQAKWGRAARLEETASRLRRQSEPGYGAYRKMTFQQRHTAQVAAREQRAADVTRADRMDEIASRAFRRARELGRR